MRPMSSNFVKGKLQRISEGGNSNHTDEILTEKKKTDAVMYRAPNIRKGSKTVNEDLVKS